MDTRMLKEYLKHTRWFRMIFALPLAIRSKILKYRKEKKNEIYQKTVVGGEIILSPQNIGGRFKMNASSDLAKRVITSGVFEPEVTNVLERLSFINGDIINIGANIGFYSIYFAQRFPNVRKVYAFEPNPEAYANLKWNILENGCSNKVEPMQTCIGDISGEVELAVIQGMSEYSAIGHIAHPAANKFPQIRIKVNISTLDEALPSVEVEPSLIFVDTEGAELNVFRGAERILKKARPVLFFECDDFSLHKYGHSSKALEEYLRCIGYTIRNAFNPRVKLQHPFVGELVAFPCDRLELVDILQGKITLNG